MAFGQEAPSIHTYIYIYIHTHILLARNSFLATAKTWGLGDKVERGLETEVLGFARTLANDADAAREARHALENYL